MLKRFYILTFIFVIVSISLKAQQNNAKISVEDIWEKYEFVPRSVPGFNFQNDGKHYTRLEENKIKQYDFTTGLFIKDIFDASSVSENSEFNGKMDDYTFSKDESKILIKTETESIYRRSTRANFYVWDKNNKTLTTVEKTGKQRYTSFSDDATKVAFVRKNNIYIKNLVNGEITQITPDGKFNSIINGSADWVYEEEFSIAKAFEWSPDGNKIAFLRFDESEVKEFTMTLYNRDLYPEYKTFKYPKVGEKNAIVSVHIFDIRTGKTTEVKTGSEPDMYFPRIKWTLDANKLCIFKMNRHQNELELLLADATSGKTSVMLKEMNKYYIDITDDMTFLEDGKCFIWTSEKDGFNHIYMYELDGKLKRQLTKGNFDVTRFYGVDEKRKTIYYQAAEESPLERQSYSISFKGKKKKKITPEIGTNRTQWSSNFDYFVNTHSTLNSPATYTVYENSGKEIRVIEDNAAMRTTQQNYSWNNFEFFNVPIEGGEKLNGWMLKPADFDPDKKYPVFMYVYGGPGSQTVTDSWGGFNNWWYQMLAQNGYIVVSVDNRGSGARGQEFKKMTYLELGKYETMDQISAAKYLGNQSYIDAERIGIFGWSYGGYMSSLCLFKGADVFKSAIAVAPVTNWKWYDTIYTERYMRTEKENESGYKDNSPVNFTDLMKGKYLLVHGVADDNVHFQNTAEMVNALIRSNKQFDTYFYPNRNHGIFGGTTRLHLYNKMTDFIYENL
ncbi:S9 family peptidase [Saprospiraceae bacterium]|nr:S9 family peptidase [Saprospiraceae bacterium]MDG1432500.1 S9 family peptidase [Saprospiraceae bacterium]